MAATSTLRSAPAAARDYPFCLQGRDYQTGYGDCRYSTYQQCQASASGTYSSCYANPYYAYDDEDRPVAGLRVLVVEDEALIRLDLVEMLGEEGYVIAGEAGDGEQAVALARELRPDLVIMDVKMPKVDGIAAAGQIVEERIAPVVMLTAFSQRDLIEQARDAGALAYLVKPFERTELVPAVEVALGRFKELRALADQTASLEEQLETRKIVDRAKGKLMDEFGKNESAAFTFIQRRAMSERVTMRDISQRIIDGDIKPDA